MAELKKVVQIQKTSTDALDGEKVLNRFGYCWVTGEVISADGKTRSTVKKPGVFAEFYVGGDLQTLQRAITLTQFKNLTGEQLYAAVLNHVLAEVGL